MAAFGQQACFNHLMISVDLPNPVRLQAKRLCCTDDPHLWKGEIIMGTNTIRLHRVFRGTPERIYRAFLDADAMVKWLPPNGFTGKVHHMDAKVGGTFKMSFTNFTTGKSHSFGGHYLELMPHERIRYTDNFDDPNLPGEIRVTVTLKKVSCGTEVNIVQEGVPDVIPAEACYLRLARITHPSWETCRSRDPRLISPAEVKQSGGL
jgi:uncharacterized protein YndB with AHSA1/START domain